MPTLPSPLHPLIVHMPIALTVLVPVFAVGALWAIRRGAGVRQAWGLATGMLALLLASGWLALQTGQSEEEKVEDVVGEQALEGHEEAAEAFLVVAGVVLVVAGAGLARGRIGSVARVAATAGTLALVGAGYNVGHSGGALVYRGNAASVYATGAAAGAAREPGVKDDD